MGWISVRLTLSYFSEIQNQSNLHYPSDSADLSVASVYDHPPMHTAEIPSCVLKAFFIIESG